MAITARRFSGHVGRIKLRYLVGNTGTVVVGRGCRCVTGFLVVTGGPAGRGWVVGVGFLAHRDQTEVGEETGGRTGGWGGGLGRKGHGMGGVNPMGCNVEGGKRWKLSPEYLRNKLKY
ncbi:hypothetical protein E2C01_028564 [Portunus trituberculatus]|uniref:Uncharacterized protein n=1 Tax=Portunus trituberculatus TaxID=210409 RepID=A0A5B7EPE9_PORTR|nr:hypothetical protein [Portunus trituberculatus]